MAISRHSHPGHGAAWTWVERPPDRGTLLSILRLIDNCVGEAGGTGASYRAGQSLIPPIEGL